MSDQLHNPYNPSQSDKLSYPPSPPPEDSDNSDINPISPISPTIILIKISKLIASSGLLNWISGEELRAWIALWNFADEKGISKASLEDLGKVLGRSEKQTAFRLRKLFKVVFKGKALIKNELSGRNGWGRFSPKAYVLLPLEAMEMKEKRVDFHTPAYPAYKIAHPLPEGEVVKISDGSDGSDEAVGKGTSGNPDNRILPSEEPENTNANSVSSVVNNKNNITTSNTTDITDTAKTTKTTKATKTTSMNPAENLNHLNLIRWLIEIGISESIAEELIKAYPKERIEFQLNMLSFRQPRHPAALFLKAIKEDWGMPQGYIEHQRANAAQKEKEESDLIEKRRKEEIEARLEERKQKIEEIKSKLKNDELKAIGERAIKKVKELLKGALGEKVPESIVEAEINKIIAAEYLGRTAESEETESDAHSQIERE